MLIVATKSMKFVLLIFFECVKKIVQFQIEENDIRQSMFSCLQNFKGKNQRHILEVAFSSKASSIKFKWDSYFVSFHFLLFLLHFSLCFRFPLLPSKWCNFNCMRDKSRRLAQLSWANPLVMLHKYRFVVSCWCLMLCVCVVYVYVHCAHVCGAC